MGYNVTLSKALLSLMDKLEYLKNYFFHLNASKFTEKIYQKLITFLKTSFTKIPSLTKEVSV